MRCGNPLWHQRWDLLLKRVVVVPACARGEGLRVLADALKRLHQFVADFGAGHLDVSSFPSHALDSHDRSQVPVHAGKANGGRGRFTGDLGGIRGGG